MVAINPVFDVKGQVSLSIYLSKTLNKMSLSTNNSNHIWHVIFNIWKYNQALLYGQKQMYLHSDISKLNSFPFPLKVIAMHQKLCKQVTC